MRYLRVAFLVPFPELPPAGEGVTGELRRVRFGEGVRGGDMARLVPFAAGGVDAVGTVEAVGNFASLDASTSSVDLTKQTLVPYFATEMNGSLNIL
jgi:hypothetical protein